MDLSHAPQAIAMTAKEFQQWSSNFVVETLRTPPIKPAIDRLTGPIWAWGQRNAIYPLHFGIACCALEMAAASACRWDAERLGMIRSVIPETERCSSRKWLDIRQAPALPEEVI